MSCSLRTEPILRPRCLTSRDFRAGREGVSSTAALIPSEILDYYDRGKEELRLNDSLGRLERIRTWEILERYLPPAPSCVLDVGGGTGVYALPLSARGYEVHLVDPV